MIAKLVVLIIVILIMTEGTLWHRSLRHKKRNLADRTPPVFDAKKNYISVNGSYNISISDYIPWGSLLQIHCSVMQDNKVIRGFCTKDLIPFEQKVRTEIRGIFEQLGDTNTDRIIKIWYSNSDGSGLDTDDIPLRIIITFFKPENMNDWARELLKQQLKQYLRDLVEVDWKEVNTVLKKCCGENHRILNVLNEISHSYNDEISMSDSVKMVLRDICSDMAFFYENSWFYGGGSTGTVFESLKTKYTEIEDCYLEKLSHEFARDTVF